MKKFRLLVFLLLINKSLSAQSIELVSHVFANTPADVARFGDYLYVINIGLVIFDFSNPSNPLLQVKLLRRRKRKTTIQ